MPHLHLLVYAPGPALPRPRVCSRSSPARIKWSDSPVQKSSRVTSGSQTPRFAGIVAGNRCRSPAEMAGFTQLPSAGSRPKTGREWTVSRVLFRRLLSVSMARIIRLGPALPLGSSARTRTPPRRPPEGTAWFRRATLDGVPI